MFPVITMLESLYSSCSFSRITRALSSGDRPYEEIPNIDHVSNGMASTGGSLWTVSAVRVGLVLVSTYTAVNVPCFGLVSICITFISMHYSFMCVRML